MHCCVPPPVASPVSPPAQSREVAAQFEGLLFSQALAPMAKACGFLGETVVGVVATDLARRDAGALGTSLERTIEAARRDEAAS